MNRREKTWERQRERACELKAGDPDLSNRDIAERMGVRAESVAAWLRGKTRNGKVLPK